MRETCVCVLVYCISKLKIAQWFHLLLFLFLDFVFSFFNSTVSAEILARLTALLLFFLLARALFSSGSFSRCFCSLVVCVCVHWCNVLCRHMVIALTRFSTQRIHYFVMYTSLGVIFSPSSSTSLAAAALSRLLSLVSFRSIEMNVVTIVISFYLEHTQLMFKFDGSKTTQFCVAHTFALR